MANDFWHVRVRPEDVQRVQDSFNDNVARTAREVTLYQARVKAASDRENVIAAMRRMLHDDQMSRPDWWQGFAVDYEALATLIADHLLARVRG